MNSEKPLESTQAFCEECCTMGVGDFYKTTQFFHYYTCRKPDENGVRHTFAIPTQEGIENLKKKNTPDANKALNSLKTEQRSKDAAVLLGVGTTVLFIAVGGEILKHYVSQHTHHGNNNNHNHHQTGHNNSTHNSGGSDDSNGGIIDWIISLFD